MGVEYDIWSHSTLREGHIFYWPFLTAYSLLSMSACKLVTNDGISLKKKYERILSCVQYMLTLYLHS